MNPQLFKLHSYPFEKLNALKQGIQPPDHLAPIALSIGEPKHPTPELIHQALISHLSGLAQYPSTKGLPELREAIAEWISRRFAIPPSAITAEHHILPVAGTREALFSFAQAVIDPTESPLIVMPNPFYQIYEGAALLAGAEPYYLNTTADNDYLPDFDAVPASVWQRCQLLYLCSPGNPTGAVIDLQTQQKLIELADRFDFIIASDECYSEIYQDENNPPPGLLEAAYTMGNSSFKRCISFQSLSKRSNAPGLRSGFVAGDADILKSYFQYRTYHGCALPVTTQHASIAAWQDEDHVLHNRRLYRQKFSLFQDIVGTVCDVNCPSASFYIWLKTPISDESFTRQLFEQQNVTVLPGSYLSRTAHGINPGSGHVRIALVASVEECTQAAQRIQHFIHTIS